MLQEQKYETKITNDIVKNKSMTKEEEEIVYKRKIWKKGKERKKKS